MIQAADRLSRERLLRRLGALLLLLPLLLWAGAARAEVTITFYSHEFGSHFPHAFVVVKGRIDETGELVDTNYGFTAANIGPHLLWGSGKGRLDLAKPSYIRDSDAHFSMVLSDADYRKVVAIVHKWRDKPQKSYNLESANCVHFVAEIAAALGLKVNGKSDFFKKPRSFMMELTQLNRPRLADSQILYPATREALGIRARPVAAGAP